MKEQFKTVFYDFNKSGKSDISNFDYKNAAKAAKFHSSFPIYKKTPFVELKNLASYLGVKDIYVKDESYRFGLNAFKVLGGSYAIGQLIAQKLNIDIDELPATRMLSDEVSKVTGDMTFITATDGNHGRGIAWTAHELNRKAIVYMPKGSSLERLNNIRKLGAHSEILDMNYDEIVRYSYKEAQEKGYYIVQDTAWEGYTDIPTWIMQGYMTMGYEITEQIKDQKLEAPTHIFIQAGVGALAGGITGFFANYYKDNKPTIVVVEPNKADCIFRTAEAKDGKLHIVTGDMDTIMAGLACGEPNPIGWNVLRDYADAFISCPDYCAADGVRVLGSPLKGDTQIISGESGASAFGCAFNVLTDEKLADLKKQLKLDENSRILFISTEGDTDQKDYRRIVWEGRYSRDN